MSYETPRRPTGETPPRPTGDNYFADEDNSRYYDRSPMGSPPRTPVRDPENEHWPSPTSPENVSHFPPDDPYRVWYEAWVAEKSGRESRVDKEAAAGGERAEGSMRSALQEGSCRTMPLGEGEAIYEKDMEDANAWFDRIIEEEDKKNVYGVESPAPSRSHRASKVGNQSGMLDDPITLSSSPRDDGNVPVPQAAIGSGNAEQERPRPKYGPFLPQSPRKRGRDEFEGRKDKQREGETRYTTEDEHRNYHIQDNLNLDYEPHNEEQGEQDEQDERVSRRRMDRWNNGAAETEEEEARYAADDYYVNRAQEAAGYDLPDHESDDNRDIPEPAPAPTTPGPIGPMQIIADRLGVEIRALFDEPPYEEALSEMDPEEEKERVNGRRELHHLESYLPGFPDDREVFDQTDMLVMWRQALAEAAQIEAGTLAHAAAHLSYRHKVWVADQWQVDIRKQLRCIKRRRWN